MEKFVPYEKLSKKEKRKMDQAKRQTWGGVNPVTRKPMNSKAYHRRKSQDWKRELPPKACDFQKFSSAVSLPSEFQPRKTKRFRHELSPATRRWLFLFECQLLFRIVCAIIFPNEWRPCQ